MSNKKVKHSRYKSLIFLYEGNLVFTIHPDCLLEMFTPDRYVFRHTKNTFSEIRMRIYPQM